MLLSWLVGRRNRITKSFALVPAGIASRLASFRPRLEALEDLTLLSTLFVTNTLDDGSIGSLRGQIIAAQNGDTIRFDPSLSKAVITLQGVLPLTTSLTIDGLGADQLTVERASADANQFRLFDVGVGVNVRLYGLHIANGFDPLGNGGGIRNAGSLSLNACWLDSNTSVGAAGGSVTSAGLNGGGGAVFNLGNLVVSICTFTGNSAQGGAGGAASGTGGDGVGGAIFNQEGLVALSNVTLFGNAASGGSGGGAGGDGIGGALANAGGTVRVFNSTLASNTSTGGVSSGARGLGAGGGIFNQAGGIVEVKNTIVGIDLAANSADVSGAFTSDGDNLVGDGTGSTGFTASGDQVGTTAQPIDPLLLSPTPQDNGGPTPTLGLTAQSPALGKGDPSSPPASDQRGFLRVVGGKIDIGALQTQADPANPVTVSTLILTPAAAMPLAKQFFAVTATVAPLLPALTSTTPTGAVAFSIDGGSSMPGVALGSLGPGKWALTLPNGLAAGPHTIVAGFAPTSNDAASSAALSLSVAPAPTLPKPGQILHNFGNAPDGWQPWGSPTLVGSTLYGYTAYGGEFQSGAIFRVNTNGTGYQVVHSFGGLLVAPGGMVIMDGNSPHHDSLRIVGNELIGATVFGGDANEGVLYAYNFVTGTYRIIHELNGYTKDYLGGSQEDGAQPHSNPMYSATDGVLYGMTSQGGKDGDGTLYQVNLDGAGFQVLHHFKTSDGYNPHGFVIQIGTVLYGLTREGGIVDATTAKNGGGVIFSFDTNGGNYVVLHYFDPTPQKHSKDDDGFGPDHGGLIQVGNSLYGLATMGGHYKDGILFMMPLNAGTYQKLYDFSGKDDVPGVIDASGPHGSLVLAPDGKTLFGMGSKGGNADDGAVFSFNTTTNAVYLLDSFQGPTSDGTDGLDNVVVSQGRLYGLTKYGGSVASNPFPTPSAPDFAPAGTPYANGTVFTLPLANPTTTTLTSDRNPSKVGQKVTFTATVTGVILGSSTPGGTVTFRDGSKVLATVALVNGKAACSTKSLLPGSHKITATFNGYKVGVYSFKPSSKSLTEVVSVTSAWHLGH